jgi:hypothetical protein
MRSRCGLWVCASVYPPVLLLRNNFVEFEVLTAVVMKSTNFWDITPCSLLSVKWRFGGIYRLHLQGRKHINSAKNQGESRCLPPVFTLVSCLTYFSTLKMEATCSSETSVDTQQTTRRYIPEDGTLYNHRCENRKSYISWFLLLTLWSLKFIEIT